MAIVRLLMPDINIPATTAMETLLADGRKIALESGANVVMINITPQIYRLKYNIYDNNETKDRKLANNRNVTNIYEKKDFKVRICYRMLTPDTCYVMLAKMKKSNNDLKDRLEIENRKLNTESDYQRVKKLLQDPKSREELINSNEEIKKEIEKYIKENGRGGHHYGI